MVYYFWISWLSDTYLNLEKNQSPLFNVPKKNKMTFLWIWHSYFWVYFYFCFSPNLMHQEPRVRINQIFKDTCSLRWWKLRHKTMPIWCSGVHPNYPRWMFNPLLEILIPDLGGTQGPVFLDRTHFERHWSPELPSLQN